MEPANWARRCCLGIGASVVGGIVVASLVWDLWMLLGLILRTHNKDWPDIIFIVFVLYVLILPLGVVIRTLFAHTTFPLTPSSAPPLLSVLVFWPRRAQYSDPRPLVAPIRLELLHCVLLSGEFIFPGPWVSLVCIGAYNAWSDH
ncbi:unnamed protein product [Cuscuta epithymum]|uniref:Uncharacterized protein n=1 Tax=Cuscuta epithymum TaxID=186058 RepID=A0AAV0C483_9ASTE|nr:unnamed protein product [Cuscuta epithymum]